MELRFFQLESERWGYLSIETVCSEISTKERDGYVTEISEEIPKQKRVRNRRCIRRGRSSFNAQGVS